MRKAPSRGIPLPQRVVVPLRRCRRRGCDFPPKFAKAPGPTVLRYQRRRLASVSNVSSAASSKSTVECQPSASDRFARGELIVACEQRGQTGGGVRLWHV